MIVREKTWHESELQRLGDRPVVEGTRDFNPLSKQQIEWDMHTKAMSPRVNVGDELGAASSMNGYCGIIVRRKGEKNFLLGV